MQSHSRELFMAVPGTATEPCLLRLLSVTGGLVVDTSFQLVGKMVDLEAARIGMRIDVALAVPELPAVVRAVPERLRRLHVAVLAHVARCGRDRVVARIRFRRAGEIDRRLREV